MYLQYCKDIIYHNYNKNPKLRQIPKFNLYLILQEFVPLFPLLEGVTIGGGDETIGEDNRDNLRSLRGRKIVTEIAILTWTAWPTTITVKRASNIDMHE